MKVSTMLGDVFTSFFQRPVTERYPYQCSQTPERFRGMLRWEPDGCTGCGICAMDCPAQAIEMIVLDKQAKRFVMVYHLDRCTFCAQCVHSCMYDCILMDKQAWELAALSKNDFTKYIGDTEDVRKILAK